jgi:hypothetical protein
MRRRPAIGGACARGRGAPAQRHGAHARGAQAAAARRAQLHGAGNARAAVLVPLGAIAADVAASRRIAIADVPMAPEGRGERCMPLPLCVF